MNEFPTRKVPNRFVIHVSPAKFSNQSFLQLTIRNLGICFTSRPSNGQIGHLMGGRLPAGRHPVQGVSARVGGRSQTFLPPYQFDECDPDAFQRAAHLLLLLLFRVVVVSPEVMGARKGVWQGVAMDSNIVKDHHVQPFRRPAGGPPLKRPVCKAGSLRPSSTPLDTPRRPPMPEVGPEFAVRVFFQLQLLQVIETD
jgi:hypothetical protein